jgi:cell division protein FtsZ
MQNAGSALMGIGSAAGDNRAADSARAAINSPLLDLSITGAKGVLFTIAGGEDLTMFEIQEAAKVITESVDNDAKVIFGTVLDDKLKKNEIKITVIACGFPEGGRKSVTTFFNQEGKVSPDNKKPEKEKVIEKIEEEPEKERESFFRPRPIIQEAPKIIEDLEDPEGDWSSIPAFLRRTKK